MSLAKLVTVGVVGIGKYVLDAGIYWTVIAHFGKAMICTVGVVTLTNMSADSRLRSSGSCIQPERFKQ